MVNLFTFFALVGGTILVCQFVLTLVGWGGDHAHGGDIGHAELHGDHGGLDHDMTSPDGHDAHGHHGSTWLFGVLSFRTLVAAATFFGLGGLVADSLKQPPAAQLTGALAAGIAAMYAVHSVMRLFSRLGEDGTMRIRRAIGKQGTVYLSIPPARSGTGKIHVSVQSRLVEFPAVTAHAEKLAIGAKVFVTGVIGTDTLEVEPVPETAQVA